MKSDVSTLYNVCGTRRRSWHIDIIDVSGWHGRCNNRHYTEAASAEDRVKASSQRVLYWRDQNMLSVPVAFGSSSFPPEGRTTGGMIQTRQLRPGQDAWEFGLAGSGELLYRHVVVSQSIQRSSAGILVKSAERRDVFRITFRRQSARFQSVTLVI